MPSLLRLERMPIRITPLVHHEISCKATRLPLVAKQLMPQREIKSEASSLAFLLSVDLQCISR